MFTNFNKGPAIAGFFLFVLTGCGTTPPEAQQFVQKNGYAGYWVNYKLSFDKNKKPEQDSYLSISCDGEIKYQINEPWALIFKVDSDDGKIKTISENSLTYKGWLGMTTTASITKPVKEANGCYKISFKGTSFRTFYPKDCSKPEKAFGESLQEAFEFAKNNNYVYCD